MFGRATNVGGSVLFRCSVRWKVALAAAMLAALPVRAAELVTLRSGFTVTCSSREAVSGEILRLYLSANGPSGNYMDVPLASVLLVEALPERELPEEHTTNAPPARPLNDLLQSSGAAHNVNVALLASVVHAESAGDPHAISRTGARGLMQLMPSTAAQLHVRDSFKPEDNVNGGSVYLDRLLTRYNDNIALALAAYNAGPGAVDRYHGMPPFRETRLYVAKVLREFNRLVQGQRAATVEAVLTPSPSQ